MSNANSKPMVTDVFVKGAVNGWNIMTHSTIPNVLMAFVLIKVLNVSGLLPIIGDVFSPIMMIFGLPGEAATVLIAGWMSIGGGVGVAAALIDQSAIGVQDIAILTGGEVLSEERGIKLDKAELAMLGQCARVVVDKENTTIVSGKGSKEAIASLSQSKKT